MAREIYIPFIQNMVIQLWVINKNKKMHLSNFELVVFNENV